MNNTLHLSNLRKTDFSAVVYLPHVHHHLIGVRDYKVWLLDRTMVTSIDFSRCLRGKVFEAQDSQQMEEQINELQKIEVGDDHILKGLKNWRSHQSSEIDSAKLIVILSRPYEFETKMSVTDRCTFHTLNPIFTHPQVGRF